MAPAQFVATSVANNIPSHDSNRLNDNFESISYLFFFSAFLVPSPEDFKVSRFNPLSSFICDGKEMPSLENLSNHDGNAREK